MGDFAAARWTSSDAVRGASCRRTRRILPPYYAALLCIGTCSLLASHLRLHVWPPITRGAFLSHLLLIHNLRPCWEYQIDVPMWSVAMEWQIYFFFPLLLLPLWRRFGIGVAVAVGFVIGLIPHFLLHRFDETSPWYLGLFSLGMAGAVVAHSSQDALVRLRRCIPWGLMSCLLGLAFCGAVFWSQYARGGHFDPYSVGPEGTWPSDVLVGMATVCLLIHGAQKCAAASRVVRFLSTRPLVTLGTFSYSIYLVHHPVLQIVSEAVHHLHLGPVPAFMLFVTMGGGGAVAVAYAFFLAFERPFLVHRKDETAAEVARDAALSPAP